jgi:hypothetical protein
VLLDHLAGEDSKGGRYFRAEGLGGLGVDHEREKSRLLKRQIGRLRCFEDAINQGGNAVEAIVVVRAVEREAGAAHHEAIFVAEHRQASLRRNRRSGAPVRDRQGSAPERWHRTRFLLSLAGGRR